MSFATIDLLTSDSAFNGRIRACCVQQAEVFKDDARPDFVSLANDQLTGGTTYLTFTRIAAAGPGFADTAGDPPDQSLIPDADILASIQGSWQVVAGLFYNEDGTPIQGG
jgi:hypothetical protein